MKTKWLRIGSLVLLLGLIAAIPASTQVLFGSSGGNAEASNLPLLVLVNRMELTTGQMEEIHGLLEGLLEEREALELRRAKLEEEMIAFTGTAEQLDEILEAFRAESVEQAEAAREHVEEVIDQVKGILTLKQGEVLAEALPGLLGERVVFLPFGQQDEDPDVALCKRLFEQMEQRFAGSLEILERLQQRLGGHERMMGRSFSGRGQRVLGFQQRSGGVNVQIHVQRGGLQHRGLGWIEQLVEVLELKLEAIG